jgi:glycerol-3-phosphate dehydrogenase
VPPSAGRRGVPDDPDPLGLTRPLAVELARAGLETERLGLDPQAAGRLVERYGDDWPDALRAITEDPALGEPAIPGLPVLRVELALARDRELALSDEDVLVRRTRLSTMARRLRSGSVW